MSSAILPFGPVEIAESRDGTARTSTPNVQMPAIAHAMPLEDAPVLSFDDVYSTHVAFVWRTLRTFGVSEASLEDAVQDVFVVVHRRLADFEGRAAITTWLFAIARRVASNYRRRAAPGRDEPIVDEHAGPADTFDAMSRAQAAATVFAILETLDEDKRVVFALVELEGLAVPEVAKLLEIKLNTAYSRLRLARAAFEAAVTKLRGAQP